MPAPSGSGPSADNLEKKSTWLQECFFIYSLGHFHYNDLDWVSWHLKSPALDCFLNSCSGKHGRKTSKPVLLAFCDGNPPVTSGFPSQRSSNAESVFMSWHHHVFQQWHCCTCMAHLLNSHIRHSRAGRALLRWRKECGRLWVQLASAVKAPMHSVAYMYIDSY